MPLYDYKCPKCGTTFEWFITLKELDKGKDVSCPECKDGTLAEKQISAVKKHLSWSKWAV